MVERVERVGQRPLVEWVAEEVAVAQRVAVQVVAIR